MNRRPPVFLRPQPRPGVGLSINDVYTYVANYAGSGAVSAGQLSGILTAAGMTTEAVRNMLLTVSQNLGADQEQMDFVADELRYLNTGAPGGGVVVPIRTGFPWGLVLVGGAVLWFVASRSAQRNPARRVVNVTGTC